jgi:hypothetical protein
VFGESGLLSNWGAIERDERDIGESWILGIQEYKNTGKEQGRSKAQRYNQGGKYCDKLKYEMN